MAIIKRHRTTWTGFVGGPGVTTLYWTDVAGPNLVAWNAFLTSIQARFPAVVTWQSQNAGDRIDEVTGAIVGSYSLGAVASVAGTAAGIYAAPIGAVVNWRTSGVVAGRRVRGRSFLVPITGASQDTDGSLGAATLTTLRGALATFLSAVGSDLLVWHRPVGGSGGSSFAVNAADIPDKCAVLRSRRD